MFQINKIAILVLSLTVFNSAFAQNAEELKQVIDSYTLNSSHVLYERVLSPAMIPDLSKNKDERIQILNEQISIEINTVLSAFNNSNEDKKQKAVLQVIKNIDSTMLSPASANLQFTTGEPGVGTARTLLMFKKKSHMTPENIIAVISSYKRAAKPSDHAYEYEDPQNLTKGKIIYTKGSDTSWTGSSAPDSFTPEKDYVLKKCRYIFGWKCNTLLYHVDKLNTPEGRVDYLFMSNYDLKNNPDHRDFIVDNRSVNQIAGTTAIYIVKESTEWILVYGLDVFFTDDSISFGALIKNEFAKDFKRLNQRLTEEINKNDFQFED